MRTNKIINEITNKKIKQRSLQGFTFIELIIVATIISILAAIAIPAYYSYQSRAKIVEAFALSATAKRKIADFYRQTGYLPIDNAAIGLPAPDELSGKYIESLRVENGVIVATFRPSTDSLSGKVLSMHPKIVKNSPTTPMLFQCGSSIERLSEGVIVVGKDQTTLPKQLIPNGCR